jgi:N-acetyl-gamma-glutamyl-phosphate reductase
MTLTPAATSSGARPMAVPCGVAKNTAWQALSAAGVKVIDLSADFRLQDPAEFARWYQQPHSAPELLAEAVYGLPEVNRNAIRQARLVANPGCYPTAVQLGLLPLLEAELIETEGLIADCKSGVSGAGREARTGSLFSEVADSFKAYGVPGHRHAPEIRQGLERAAQGPVGITFVPHLLPLIRGIHATLYARLKACSRRATAPSPSWMSRPPATTRKPAGYALPTCAASHRTWRRTAVPSWCCR